MKVRCQIRSFYFTAANDANINLSWRKFQNINIFHITQNVWVKTYKRDQWNLPNILAYISGILDGFFKAGLVPLTCAGAPIVTQRGGVGFNVPPPRLTRLLSVAETCGKRHSKKSSKPNPKQFQTFFARIKIVASRGKILQNFRLFREITFENLHCLGNYDRWNKSENGIPKRIKFPSLFVVRFDLRSTI